MPYRLLALVVPLVSLSATPAHAACLGEVLMRTILLTVMLLAMPVVATLRLSGYITPPWNFEHHPKYDGRTARSIPLNDWEQLAAFDSAAQCEKGRLFARTIRDLAPMHREHLLAAICQWRRGASAR